MVEKQKCKKWKVAAIKSQTITTFFCPLHPAPTSTPTTTSSLPTPKPALIPKVPLVSSVPQDWLEWVSTPVAGSLLNVPSVTDAQPPPHPTVQLLLGICVLAEYLPEDIPVVGPEDLIAALGSSSMTS